MSRKALYKSAFTIAVFSVTFCAIWLFLWLRCPQYLLYQEQNQLFLFTWNYFINRISVPGGLDDYLSEFVVQFYYVPLYGSLLAALVLTLSQIFSGLAISRNIEDSHVSTPVSRRCNLSDMAFPLATIPSFLYLGAMSDENILLSFAVAMMLTSLLIYLTAFIRNNSTFVTTLTLIAGFALLYWIAGPLAFSFVIAAGILRRSPKAIAIALPVAFIFVWVIHFTLFGQYPLSRMLQGLNYYRVPEIYPAILYVIAGIMAFLPLLSLLKTRTSGFAPYASAAVVAVFALTYVPVSFNETKSKILAYDSLVRQRRWTDIIEKAKKENPTDIFSLQAVNLALGMTGQLPESMFQFNQKGIEGLIGRNRLDNTTQLITAEALYHLGLTNIAFSTTFDLQESIMNDRKSGRHMKRMAECMIINGNYKVAEKYIGFLRNSMFYADWAKQAEKLLGNDSAVEAHKIYGPLRRNAFKKEAFFDHTQLHKILALHALDSNGKNPLAWQYFCGSTLLNGDLATLIGVYNSSSDKFDSRQIPRHIQEAIAMYWTFSHQSFDGVPFPLSDEVKHQTAALARAVMQNKNNPAAWQNVARGTYGLYFVSKSYSGSQPESSQEYQHTHE